MPKSLEEIASVALALPVEERVVLADRLLASLEDADPSCEKLWLEEAKRRRDEVRNGKVQTIPAEEALARVRRSLGR
jgi:putative addiction module component (TIGR02574 family)